MAMIYIETGSTSPAVNLAFEEYFFRKKDLEDDILMLWRNEPAVVVGRNQNVFAEINRTSVSAMGIQVLRRISGGGAVYHDLGNLCYGFIFKGMTPNTIDKPRLVSLMVDALINQGVKAELTKRNDMVVEGKKFSGNAFAQSRDRILFHGTLLYETDLNILSRVLTGPSSIIATKGTQSVPSPITNLKPFMPEGMDILQFKKKLGAYFLGKQPEKVYCPTYPELEAIQDLATQKYLSWEWNFGNSPPSILEFSVPLTGDRLEIHLELEKGAIKLCALKSPAVEAALLSKIEKKLSGLRYIKEDIQAVLNQFILNPLLREEMVEGLMGF